MKAGVSKEPCLVVTRPVRAAVSLEKISNSKDIEVNCTAWLDIVPVMKATIRLKGEDLIEANANVYQQKTKNQQWKIRVGVIGWIVFFLLVAALWALLQSNAPPAGAL